MHIRYIYSNEQEILFTMKVVFQCQSPHTRNHIIKSEQSYLALKYFSLRYVTTQYIVLLSIEHYLTGRNNLI